LFARFAEFLGRFDPELQHAPRFAPRSTAIRTYISRAMSKVK
jgi:hypothetical protein